MEHIVQLIRDHAPSARFRSIQDVADACAIANRQAIPQSDFSEALKSLQQAGLILVRGSQMKLVEYDAPEKDLYDPLEDRLHQEGFLEQIRVAHGQTVFHRTAYGGVIGSGQFSRPDFTLATIRQFTFDPVRHLDVLTFEVKNLAGTNLLAVHEALAHTRFGHYSFVVIPTSTLDPSITEMTKQHCTEHGLGLITFSITAVEPEVRISNLEVELQAVRNHPDPHRVERFLTERLPQDKQDQLKQLAHAS